MTSLKKSFPWPALAVVTTLLLFTGGQIYIYGANAQRLSNVEEKCKNMYVEQDKNSTEHKLIMERLGDINTGVMLLQTELKYIRSDRRRP